METLWQDVRYGVRTLARRPGFTLVAVVTLALGIGANAAIYSVIDAVLLRPLPFRDPGRLVGIWETRLDRGWAQSSFTHANFWDVHDLARSFDGIAAMGTGSINLTGLDHPDRLGLGRVSADFFSVLGVTPVLGRTFEAGEDTPGGNTKLVLVSHRLWTSRFGRDPTLVGRSIVLDGEGYLVIGILPRGEPWLDEADVFIPMVRRPDADRGSFELLVIGRLKPGVTLDAAKADLSSVAKTLEARFPADDKGMGIGLESSERWVAGDSLRRALWILMGAVGFLLLIACVNLANLFLARGTGQARERALRTALGATRLRIGRQVLTESLLVSAAGAVVGLALAMGVLRILRALAPAGIPRLDQTGINPVVLALTAAATILTAVLAGLVPAMNAGKGDVVTTLRDGDRGVAGHRFLGRLRGMLVAVEVAASLALLIGAGLLLRSMDRVLHSDRGFETSQRVLAEVAFPNSYNGERVSLTIQQIADKLSAEPGVVSVAALSWRPLQGVGVGMGFAAADKPSPSDKDVPWAGWRIVTRGYLHTMGIPLLRGRDFDEHDIIGKPWRVIVSRRVAERLWPGEDAIGRQMILWKGQSNFPAEVIGVAGDTREWGLAEEPALTVYLPYYGGGMSPVNFAIHTASSPALITTRMRAILSELDSSLPLGRVESVEDLVRESVASRRFVMLLLAAFAGVALALALAGVYGVLAYAVARRTSEIGVRLALGARQTQVLRLIVAQGMRPVFVGLVGGAVTALALTRLMASLLFGVGASDPLTFVSVAGLLTMAAVVACWIPARQAIRVDVVAALRKE